MSVVTVRLLNKTTQTQDNSNECNFKYLFFTTLSYYSLYLHNSDPPVANTSEYLARTETSEFHSIKKKKFFNALTEQCNICHKRFSGQFKLKKHLKKAHNMTLIQTQPD